MKITKKIVGAVILPLILFMAIGLVVIMFIFTMHANNQERQEHDKAIGDAVNHVKRAETNLYETALTLSMFNETYDIAFDEDSGAIKQVFEKMGVDFICFYNDNRYYINSFGRALGDIQLELNVFFTAEENTDIRIINGNPYFIAKTKYIASPNQYIGILLGNEIDSEFLAELDSITNGETSVVSENDINSVPLSNNAYLKIDFKDREVNGIFSRISLTIAIFVIIILLTLFVLLWFVNRYINTPLENLINKIRGVSLADIEKCKVSDTYDGEFLELTYTIDNLLTTNAKMLKQIKKSESELRLILDSVVEGIFGLDLEGNCTFCNRGCLSILGYDRDVEILGKNIKELTEANILSHNSNETMTCEFRKKDGTIIQVELYCYPKKEDCKVVGYVVTFIDITERKEMENKLSESQRSNDLLLSNLMGMVYRCKNDEHWTMLYVSDGCYELTGYKAESLLNNKDISFCEIITESDRERVRKQYDEVLANRGVFRKEYKIITADGGEKWVLEQGQGVYDDEGNVIAIEGLIIDISSQKEREKEIEYLSYHDALTNVCNRIFLDKEKERFVEQDLHPISVIVGDIDGLKFINDAFGHSVGDELIAKTAKILKGCLREGDVIARVGGDEFNILLPKTEEAEAHKILKMMQRKIAEFSSENKKLYRFTVSLGYSTKYTAEEDFTDVIKLADEYMYKRKLLERHSSHSAIIASIRETMNARNIETDEHCERLAKLSKNIAKAMNLSEKEVDELVLLSSLHDIGKVGIKDTILKKKTVLTKSEYHEMKKHPLIGYRIAMATPELKTIAPYILTHHERWDGCGYPQGLKGEEVPLVSRILAVIDTYDALTQERPYRKAVSTEEALKEIEKNAGTQFDPAIVKIFVDWMRKND